VVQKCNIKSLNDISNLFKRKITLFDLSENLIEEIDFDMDYGAAIYIYMHGCPISEKYFKWDEHSDEYPGKITNAKGVVFGFGYYEDGWWVIENTDE